MPRRRPEAFTFPEGFIYTQNGIRGVPGSLIDGRNLLVFPNGLVKSAKGPLAGTASGAPRPAMNVKSTFGGISSYGTVLSFYDVIFAAGSGTVTLTGASIGSVSDVLAVQTGAGLVTAGVPAPGAPTVSSTPPTSGRLIGSYSLRLTAVRLLGNLTGESTGGPASVAVAMTNKKFRVTAWPSTPAGCDATRDKWGLYFPFRGFPTQGPWRHLSDVAMNTALPFDIDFLDGDLGHLLPLDYDPPPTPVKFAFSIDNVVVVIGTGGRLSPSVPLLPEAYPPDKIVFLARGEDVTGCKSSGASGRIVLACANSLHEVVGTVDDTLSPIMAYPRWPSTGFVGSSSWCFYEDMIFGMSGAMGPVMGTLDDGPRTEFARDVLSFFEDNGYTSANTVVGYDPSTNSVIWMSGSIGLPYSLTNRKWSTKYEFPGTVNTAVTVNGQLLIDIGGTNYVFEGGTGTNFDGTPAWWDGGNSFLKTIVRVRAASDTTLTLQPLIDLSTSPAGSSFTSAAQHGNPKRLALRKATSFTCKFSGSGSRKTIRAIDFQAITHPVTDH